MFYTAIFVNFEKTALNYLKTLFEIDNLKTLDFQVGSITLRQVVLEEI